MTSPAPSPSPRQASPPTDGAPAPKRQKVDHEADEESASSEPRSESEDPSAEPGEADLSSASTAASDNAASVSTGPNAAPVDAPDTSALPVSLATASAGDWQALWSPVHNAYYFYNSKTQETTWTNPLEASSSASPVASSSSDPQAFTSTAGALQAAAAAQGIDPSLAYLDPSLVAGTSSTPQAFTYTAKFNARTGAFARPDGRDPSHVSEYERARRMSEAYFDVGEWEEEVEQRKAQEEAEGKKKKKPTKKDLERFKEQKRLKKIAKTAWLRT